MRNFKAQDLPGFDLPNYYAIMGPWSSQQTISRLPNYLYKNYCLELNNGHNGATPWSDPDIVYYGPHEVKPSDPHTNFTEYSGGDPVGNTLYPVILGDSFTETFENMSLEGWGKETYTGNNGFVWNIDAKGTDGYIDSSKCVYMIYDRTGVYSGTISGGISSFPVQCRDLWEEGVQRTLQLLINGSVISSVSHTGTDIYTFSAENINIPGEFTIGLRNVTPSPDEINKSVSVDNITRVTCTENSVLSSSAELDKFEPLAFPNPFTTSFAMKPGDYSQLFLIDITGKVILSKIFTSENEVRFTLDYSQVPAGIYFLKLISGNDVRSIKIIRK